MHLMNRIEDFSMLFFFLKIWPQRFAQKKKKKKKNHPYPLVWKNSYKGILFLENDWFWLPMRTAPNPINTNFPHFVGHGCLQWYVCVPPLPDSHHLPHRGLYTSEAKLKQIQHGHHSFEGTLEVLQKRLPPLEYFQSYCTLCNAQLLQCAVTTE